MARTHAFGGTLRGRPVTRSRHADETPEKNEGKFEVFDNIKREGSIVCP
jgi:hypothetical protein